MTLPKAFLARVPELKAAAEASRVYGIPLRKLSHDEQLAAFAMLLHEIQQMRESQRWQREIRERGRLG